MANSKKRCKQCKQYEPVNTGKQLPSGFFCSIEHATEWALEKHKIDREKQQRKKHREDLKRVRRNPRAEALKMAQLLARLRESDDLGYCKCCTCGKINKYNDGFDGGHFIAKGSSSYWMLDPRNIHPQCVSCNRPASANRGNSDRIAQAYTLFMIDKYGREFVDHMTEMQRVVIKRTTADYDQFIQQAKIEIALHKKRIGASR